METCRNAPPSAAFTTDERGAVSVEFAIWMPLLASLIVLIADVSSAFTTQALMWRSASEVARGLATGRLSPEEVTQASGFALGAPPSFDNDGFVTVELIRPFADIGTGILLPPLGTLRVQIRHMVEPHVLEQN
jgi:Flp pilus assembly pilin Flp